MSSFAMPTQYKQSCETSTSNLVRQTDEFGNTIAADNVRHLWDLPATYVRYELLVSPEKASIIEVKGDSMAPTLMSGDWVMIDTSDTSPTPPGESGRQARLLK